MGTSFTKTIGTFAIVGLCALGVMAPTASAEEAQGGSQEQATSLPHLNPLTKRQAKKAARHELRLELDGDGTIEGLKCKKRGPHMAMCTAHGSYDGADEEGAEGDDEGEGASTWTAKLRVTVHRDQEGKRRFNAMIVRWTEDGDQCDWEAEGDTQSDGSGAEDMQACEGAPDEQSEGDAPSATGGEPAPAL